MALGPMIVDLTGLTLTDEDRRRLAHPHRATIAQVSALTC